MLMRNGPKGEFQFTPKPTETRSLGQLAIRPRAVRERNTRPAFVAKWVSCGTDSLDQRREQHERHQVHRAGLADAAVARRMLAHLRVKSTKPASLCVT